MQQQVVDKADSVRAGEELDVSAVHNWLKENISASSPSLKAMIQSSDSLPQVTQYSGGASIGRTAWTIKAVNKTRAANA